MSRKQIKQNGIKLSPQALEAYNQLMEITKKNGGQLPSELNPMLRVEEIMQKMSFAIQTLNQQVSNLGQNLAINQLTVNLLTTILVDNKLITTEDFENRFKVEVLDKYRSLLDAEMERQNKLKEQLEKEEEEEVLISSQNVVTENEEVDLPEETSSTVLASERNNLIVFPSSKE